MDLPEAPGGLEASVGDPEAVAASQDEARTDDITVTVTPALSNIEAEREEANIPFQTPASEVGAAAGRADLVEVLAECDTPPEHLWQVAAEEGEADQRMLTRRAEKSSQTETLKDDLGGSETKFIVAVFENCPYSSSFMRGGAERENYFNLILFLLIIMTSSCSVLFIKNLRYFCKLSVTDLGFK